MVQFLLLPADGVAWCGLLEPREALRGDGAPLLIHGRNRVSVSVPVPVPMPLMLLRLWSQSSALFLLVPLLDPTLLTFAVDWPMTLRGSLCMLWSSSWLSIAWRSGPYGMLISCWCASVISLWASSNVCSSTYAR
jgi:hypothetical protein